MSDQPAACWPACAETMHARARRLIDADASDEEVLGDLQEAFPGLLLITGPDWRRDAIYQNVLAQERMASVRQARGRPLPPAPNAPGQMSPGLVAFAESRGLVCAYCGQAGTRTAGPDGLAWHRDSVPRGFQIDGHDLELACSACRTDGARYHRLGGVLDAV